MRFSSKARLLAFAVVAVALPTAIFSFIQYRSLIDLENKTRVEMQERLRQTLRNVGYRVGDDIKSIATEALHPLGAAAADFGPGHLSRIERHFAAVRQAHPAIGDLFVIPTCPCDAKAAALFSTASGPRHIEQARFKEDALVVNAITSYENARSSEISIDAKNDLIFWTSHLGCGSSPEGLRAYVFYPLYSAGQKKRVVGFAGFTLDPAHLRGSFLPEAVAAVLRDAEGDSADLSIAVRGEQGQEIYQSRPGANNVEAKVMFYPAFPRWYLVAGYTNTTVDALARNHFQKSAALSVLALALLTVGFTLTLRAIAREAKLAQAKSTFVSNVSHELKTPLALIRLFAETLELGRVKSPDKAQEYYRIINSESRRLTQLIDNILDFSKIEAGRKEYQFAPADVTEVIADVLHSYQYQLANAGFELTTDLQRGLPAAAVDRDAIAQAALNLLNNAVKYSDAVKKVAVGTRLQGNNILIEVTDCGIGIPQSEQERIFDKFYRVNNDLVHNIKGSGLGLALVRHIVEAHRGRVRVESAPGKGSRFTIAIPVEAVEVTDPTFGAGGYRVAESSHH